jgi:hypothetical protein
MSRACPRCTHWHDITAACPQRAALDAYLRVMAGQQAAADRAETIALARYRLGRRP